MFLKTVIVGHVRITKLLIVVIEGVKQFIIDVTPTDTPTATMATTKLVFGMFRHHHRMVLVATLAGNLVVMMVISNPLELFQKNSSKVVIGNQKTEKTNHNSNKFHKFKISYSYSSSYCPCNVVTEPT